MFAIAKAVKEERRKNKNRNTFCGVSFCSPDGFTFNRRHCSFKDINGNQYVTIKKSQPISKANKKASKCTN